MTLEKKSTFGWKTSNSIFGLSSLFRIHFAEKNRVSQRRKNGCPAKKPNSIQFKLHFESRTFSMWVISFDSLRIERESEKSVRVRTRLISTHSNSNQLMYIECVVCFHRRRHHHHDHHRTFSFALLLHTRIEIVFNRTVTEIDVAYRNVYGKRDNTSDIHTHYMHGEGDTMIYLTRARTYLQHMPYNMFFFLFNSNCVLCCAVLCCTLLHAVHCTVCVCVRTSKRVQSMNKRYMYILWV